MSFFSTRWLGFAAGAALLALSATVPACTYSHGDPTIVVPCDNATPALATYAGVIAPIFAANCLRCHGATVYLTDGGGYDFSSRTGIVGYGRPDRLLCCIRHEGCDDMPKDGSKLSDCDIARIQAWIDAGQPNN